MNKTSSMIYRPTAESEELYIVANNDSRLYNSMILPIIKNLHKKVISGVYDTEKAVTAFYHVATEASRQYKKDYGYAFTVTERWTAAADLLRSYEDEILEA